MYEDLVKRLNVFQLKEDEYQIIPVYVSEIIGEAAEAIEELSKLHETQKRNLSVLTDELIRCWIPVTERLPEENVCVLVWGGYFAKVMETAILDDGLFYSAWDNRTEMFGVTHWMPLPPAPKEGE